ncbi:N(2),N(2)-dimethylguanosine tRNA methyltransferase, putative [Plasmodium ovale wallikeri]|uniref:tRNA (guanine(26)-N(2))-dimethyltransferase n=2 Tax=Plasmodium ovale TaxID=36330 RepID=A0A1A8ZV23_PLAOA|nr:N(2),N(2)-dimethylguanosine tRNA methyltransferase, putative [Plasmodium ovale wallikeri]SBT48236.1 N(2),N(2)-dimethylguanosine tRNA methyltransferase, putative [Plasmodium ovale wallikeri]SBT82357.1 N2,N2-dimethylguanosine tRNA methyltransferase, putative [Plasmodium ovale]
MIGASRGGRRNERPKRKFAEGGKNGFCKKFNGTNKRSIGGGGECGRENNKYIFEGSVKIKNKNKHIFYNKTQVFNRDMSIILIKALEIYLKEKNKDNEKTLFRGFNVIELLSASGIRSIRYVKELRETINHIIANDIDKYACKQIRRNFKRNNISKEKYTILCNDANSVMNILNIDNVYTKKRNNKKLDIGFTYINNINNYYAFFKQGFSFLKFLTNYNKGKNSEDKETTQDSDSTAFSSNDDMNTKMDSIEEEYDYLEEKKYNNSAQFYEKGDAPTNASESVEGDQNGGTLEKKMSRFGDLEGTTEIGDTCIGDKKLLNEMTMDEIMKKSKEMEKYMFDIIDIDPYGSSIEYLESCLRYGRSNFFILITNTDMRILNGKFPDVSFYKYNSMIFSKKVSYNNEFSIRVLFYKIKAIASKYKKCVIPYCSLNIDFYIRILIQVLDDALQTKELCVDSGLVYQCCNCSSFYINPLAFKKDVSVSLTENGIQSKRWKKNKKKNSLANEYNDDYDDNDQEKTLEQESHFSAAPVEGEYTQKGKETEQAVGSDNINDVTINGKDFVDYHAADTAINEKKDTTENCEEIEENRNNGRESHIGYKYKSSKLHVSNKCEECGGDMQIGGPIYIGKLHNIDFIHTCISLLEHLQDYNLNTIKSRERILINFRCLKQEINIPLYYNMPALFRNFKICSFSRKLLVNALLNLNYEVSYFHKDPDSVKTNAPNHIFMDVFRAIIFKINSKTKNTGGAGGKQDAREPNGANGDAGSGGNSYINENGKNSNDNNCNANNEGSPRKVYSISTIKDEKLREKLLSFEFFKKNTSFENINISNYKNNKTHLKLFTMDNPEPFWGPMKKHAEKN